MTIFFILVGVSALGMGLVAFWMLKDKEDEEATVEKIAPEKLHSIQYQGLPPGSEPAAPAMKKVSLLGKLKSAKQKKESEHAVPMFKDDDEPKPKGGLAGKLKLGNILEKLPLKKHPKTDPDEDPGTEKSIVKKILSKFKFGKKKDENDDVPVATSFPSLKDKLKTFSKDKTKSGDKDNDKPLPLLKDVQTGTASLSTATTPKREDGITMPMLKSDKPAAPKQELSGDEQKKIASEVESATELAELKKRHETLEKLLSEKNGEMEKLKASYETEVANRKDFNKIKDLLEKELKEVKDRVKQAKAELSESHTENENQQKRIKQLEEKATKLEKEILAKEEEINAIKRPAATPAPAKSVDVKAPEPFKASEPPKAAEAPKAPEPPKVPETPAAPKTPETPKAPEQKIDYTPKDLPQEPAKEKEAPKEAPKQEIKPPSEGPKAEIKKERVDNISKFEESLGISTGAAAATAPAPKPAGSAPQAPQPPDAAGPSEPTEAAKEPADETHEQPGGFLKLTPDPIAETPPPTNPNEQDKTKGPQS